MVIITIFGILSLIIGLICIVVGNKKIFQAQQIKIIKQQSLEQEQKVKEQLISEIESLIKEKEIAQEELRQEEQYNQQKYQDFKIQYAERINMYQQNMQNASEQYVEKLEKSYNKAEREYQQKKEQLQLQQKQIEDDIQNAGARLSTLKTEISAATEAQLREREKEEKLDFYKLSISPLDLDDIEKLESVKLMLHNPTILNKLIWSTYFQKQTTELCNRVLGANTICGIYKITDLKTKQCYIGQSVNIQDRIKQHIKCGLGIDAPATNKLYNAMQRDGVWNFTFELLEKCPKDKLDEAEKRWIEIYQSNKIGLNITKGGSGK